MLNLYHSDLRIQTPFLVNPEEPLRTSRSEINISLLSKRRPPCFLKDEGGLFLTAYGDYGAGNVRLKGKTPSDYIQKTPHF